jgi:hypothetical protein
MTAILELARLCAEALESPGCERLKEWSAIGPVQRAAVEQFAAIVRQEALEEAAKDAKRYQAIRNHSDVVASSFQRGFALAHYGKSESDRQALDARCDEIAALDAMQEEVKG